MKTATETKLLVIGYGNTLRSDDAAGPLVAERVAMLGLPGVRTLVRTQLLPEMAAELAEAAAVVFVDASAINLSNVELEPISPDRSASVGSHAADPRAVLAMASELYGHAPTAWLLKVPAERFDHGETLSRLTQRGIDDAVLALQHLAVEWMF